MDLIKKSGVFQEPGTKNKHNAGVKWRTLKLKRCENVQRKRGDHVKKKAIMETDAEDSGSDKCERGSPR